MRRTQNGGHGGTTQAKNKIGHAHQACRLAKRVSVGMNAAIASKDNPRYYDETLALGKRSRKVHEHEVAGVPVDAEG